MSLSVSVDAFSHRSPARAVRRVAAGALCAGLIAMTGIVTAPSAQADPMPSWIAYIDTSDLEPASSLNYDPVYGHQTDPRALQLSPSVLGGTLKDFLRGGAPIPGVQIASIITRNNPSAILSTGHRGRAIPGTDAWQEFGQIVSLHGNYSFPPGLTHTARITGLNPNRSYTIVVTANRDLESNFPDPSGRQANFELQSVEGFTNASTPGTIATDGGATITFDAGKNTERGYVARWTGVKPGSDGLIDLSSVYGTSADNTAYGPSAMKIVEEAVTVPGQDITRPVITLVGPAQITVPVGAAYVDQGATALDDRDGDLTAHMLVTGQVDISIAGDYTIRYEVIDRAGNRALPVERVVRVRGTLTTATPTIGGTPTVGENLTADPGNWQPAPVAFTWQWLRDGTPIPAATAATYQVQQADLGHRLTVRVTGSKTYHEPATTISAGVDALPSTPPGAENPDNGKQWVAFVDTYATNAVPATVLGLTPSALSGTLRNHATGRELTGVTIQAIAVDGSASPGTGGSNAAAGTPAGVEFGNVVSLAGNYSFSGSTRVRTLISGLDPAHTYTLAATANRNSAATPAKSTFTLAGADAYASASSAGTTVSGPAVTFATDLNSTGKVAKWTRIRPGADGVIELVASVGTGAATAYAPGAIKLLEEPLVGKLDTTAPVIRLVGKAEMQLAANSTFTDPGVVATDDVDGDITKRVVVGGQVTSATPGSYTITYDVTDAAGNSAIPVQRVVTVSPPAVPEKNFVAPKPTIAGVAKVGSRLTVNIGTWAPLPDRAFTYQWFRRGPKDAHGVKISGATSRTYLVTARDHKKKLYVTVTGTRAGYKAHTRTSASTKAVKAGTLARTPAPKITGTVKVGRTLVAKPYTWEPSRVKLSYQWYRNGRAIKGATKAKYKLVKADKKKRIVVKVTGKKTGYATVSRISSQTARVR